MLEDGAITRGLAGEIRIVGFDGLPITAVPALRIASLAAPRDHNNKGGCCK